MLGHSSTHHHLHPQAGQRSTAKTLAIPLFYPRWSRREGDGNRDTMYLLVPLPSCILRELAYCTYQKALEAKRTYSFQEAALKSQLFRARHVPWRTFSNDFRYIPSFWKFPCVLSRQEGAGAVRCRSHQGAARTVQCMEETLLLLLVLARVSGKFCWKEL